MAEVTDGQLETQIAQIENETVAGANTKTRVASTMRNLKDSKVHKVSGKGLSTNDYDNAAKTKVDAIDQVYSAAEKTKLSSVDQVYTAAEKTKVAAIDQVYTSAEKTKVAAIITNGNGTSYLANDGTYKTVSAGGGTVDTVLADGSTNAIANNAVFDALALKVDKDGAKVLSDNNYSSADKTKVDAIDQVYTSAEKTKVSAIDQVYTAAEKTKVSNLSGVNTGDQDLSGYATTLALTTHTGNTSNPHNVTKAQVGLSNVDNTSDASKNSATATLTNKTISGSNNTLTNIPASSISGIISSANLPQLHFSDADFAGSGTEGDPITVIGGGGSTGDVTLNGTQTLTNKTISGASNTLSNIPQSSVTSLVSDLSAKQTTITLTTTGTSGAATFNSTTGALNIPQYSGGGGGTSINYRKKQTLRDHFLHGLTSSGSVGELRWAYNGGTVSYATDTGRAGVMRRAAANTATSSAMYLVSGDFVNTLKCYHFVSQTWVMRNYDTVRDYDARMGVANQFSSNPATNWFGFECLQGDANWYCVTRAGGTQTRTDTGIAFGTAWKDFKWTRDNATGNVSFYYSTDGGSNYTLIATHTTNLVASSTLLVIFSQIFQNATAGDRKLEFDYFECELDRLDE